MGQTRLPDKQKPREARNRFPQQFAWSLSGVTAVLINVPPARLLRYSSANKRNSALMLSCPDRMKEILFLMAAAQRLVVICDMCCSPVWITFSLIKPHLMNKNVSSCSAMKHFGPTVQSRG